MINILLSKVSRLNRKTKQFIMMLSDVFLIFFILVNSFALRLGEWAIPGEPLLFIIILAIPIAIPIFYGFGLYWTVVRHIGLKALWTSSLAITFYSMVWGILVLMLQLDFFPRSVIIINWLLSIIFYYPISIYF